MKYLFLLFIISCSATSEKELDTAKLGAKAQKQLQEQINNFKDCSKFINFENQTTQSVVMTFRLTPDGKLETMSLDEKHQYDPKFYNCLYNTIDQISFSGNSSGTTLEIEQLLMFQKHHE